ncbi:hypothetical protein SLE2022_050420 [Rubroshorea leprosula]
MKCSISIFVAAVYIIFFFLLASISADRQLNPWPTDDYSQATRAKETIANPNMHKERRASTVKRNGAHPLKIAGSSLPDCSHTCGSCSPCKLVMVSFVCASLEEAETCPMAYKCMCNNKCYPVP